jgi:hypothetical protein
MVFVGGLHRSATTLLGRLLAQHPSIAGMSQTNVIEDEGQLLQSVYPDDNAHGGPGRFAFDPAAHLTEHSPLVTRDNADAVLNRWYRHWDRSRPILLEKSPANLIRGRFLQAMFPGSSFVFIVRHPIAVSLATHKWSGTGVHSLVHHWLLAHQLMREDLPLLERAVVITYEALVRDTEGTLRGIEQFLGLPPHAYQSSLRSNGNGEYYRMWHESFLTTVARAKPVPTLRSFYGHRSRLRNINLKRAFRQYMRQRLFGGRQLSVAYFEAQDAVSVFEPAVRALGYSLIDLEAEPSSPIVTW